MHCVAGTGVDLVENSRVQELVDRWGARFKDKVFLEREQKYCESKALPWLHYAGRLAVKEAVAKAFGTGISADIGWLDIEVVRNSDSGAPSVNLTGRGGDMARSRGIAGIMISLSHTREYAVAHALLLGVENGRER